MSAAAEVKPGTEPDEPQQPETDAAPASEPDALPSESRKPRTRRSRTKGEPSAAKVTKPRASTSRRAKKVDIAKGMTDMYVAVGMGLSMIPSKRQAFGQPANLALGQTIATNAPDIGAAWAKVADDNPAVREALERMLAVSAFGTLLTAHLPIVAVAGITYGLVPEGLAAMFFAGQATGDGAPEQQQQAAA